MTKWETLEAIIAEINEYRAEIEDAGEWIIDCVVDQREDDGLPPFTPEELTKAEAECDRVAETVQALEARIDELREKYSLLSGTYPRYSYATGRYDHDWAASFT